MNAITHKIAVMFVIMAVGVICGKVKLITPNTNKKLSGILLFLVSPMITFMSYQKEYSSEVTLNLLFAAILAAATHVIMILLSNLLISKKSKNREISILSAVFSNCAFMGIPVVESVFGSDAIIYLTMYITVFHLLTWTYGVSVMTGETSFSDTAKHLFTPAVISVVLGLLFYFLQIPLPEIAAEPINLIGSMNTPLAMLVAGATLAYTEFSKLFKNPGIIYISFLRLLLFPAIASLLCAGLVRLGAEPLPLTVIVIASGCPSAVINVNFAHKYNMDSVYASQIFTLTTVLCAVTIPLILKFLAVLGV